MHFFCHEIINKIHLGCGVPWPNISWPLLLSTYTIELHGIYVIKDAHIRELWACFILYLLPFSIAFVCRWL